MVTKRGTNEVHGSARLFDVDHHFQSDNLPVRPTRSRGNPAPSRPATTSTAIQDYGAEVGGPVVEGPHLAVGLLRPRSDQPDHGGRGVGQDDARRLQREVELADRSVQLGGRLVSAQRQAEVRPQRGAHAPAADDLGSDAAAEHVEVSRTRRSSGSSLFFTAQYNGAERQLHARSGRAIANRRRSSTRMASGTTRTSTAPVRVRSGRSRATCRTSSTPARSATSSRRASAI